MCYSLIRLLVQGLRRCRCSKVVVELAQYLSRFVCKFFDSVRFLYKRAAPSHLLHRIGSRTGLTSANADEEREMALLEGSHPPSRVDNELADLDPRHSVSVFATVPSAGKSLSLYYNTLMSLVLVFGVF